MRTLTKSCLFAFLAMGAFASHGQVERTATGARLVRKDGKDFVSFANPSTGESVYLHVYEQPPTAKLYAWPDRRMLSLSPVYDGPIKLKAGEKLRLRYVVRVRGNTNM